MARQAVANFGLDDLSRFLSEGAGIGCLRHSSGSSRKRSSVGSRLLIVLLQSPRHCSWRSASGSATGEMRDTMIPRDCNCEPCDACDTQRTPLCRPARRRGRSLECLTSVDHARRHRPIVVHVFVPGPAEAYPRATPQRLGIQPPLWQRFWHEKPAWIEQLEPGGASCTTRNPSFGAKSTPSGKPT